MILMCILSFAVRVAANGDLTPISEAAICPDASFVNTQGKNDLGISSVAVSNGKDYLASCKSMFSVSIQDNHGKLLAIHEVNREYVFVGSLSFDPKFNDRLFFTSAHGLYVWDWKSKAAVRPLAANDKFFDSIATIDRVATSSDGKFLALINNRHRVVVIKNSLELKNLEPTIIQEDQDSAFLGGFKPATLSFAPDCSIIAVSRQNEVGLYDLKTQKKTGLLKGHSDVVYSMCFINNEFLVTGSADGTCRIWNIRKGESRVITRRDNVEIGILTASSPDGKRFACEYGGAITVFSFPELVEVKHIKGPRSGFASMVFLPDSRHIVSAGEASSVQFWDIVEGVEVKKDR